MSIAREIQSYSARVEHASVRDRLRAKLSDPREHLSPTAGRLVGMGPEIYTVGSHAFQVIMERGNTPPRVVHEAVNNQMYFLLHHKGVIPELELTTPKTVVHVTKETMLNRAIAEAGEIHASIINVGSAVEEGKLVIGEGQVVMAINGGEVDADTVVEAVSSGPNARFKANSVELLSVEGTEEGVAHASIGEVGKYLVLSDYSDVQVNNLGDDAFVIVLDSEIEGTETVITYNGSALVPGIYRGGETGLEAVAETDAAGILSELTGFWNRRQQENILPQEAAADTTQNSLSSYVGAGNALGYGRTIGATASERGSLPDQLMLRTPDGRLVRLDESMHRALQGRGYPTGPAGRIIVVPGVIAALPEELRSLWGTSTSEPDVDDLMRLAAGLRSKGEPEVTTGQHTGVLSLSEQFKLLADEANGRTSRVDRPETAFLQVRVPSPDPETTSSALNTEIGDYHTLMENGDGVSSSDPDRERKKRKAKIGASVGLAATAVGFGGLVVTTAPSDSTPFDISGGDKLTVLPVTPQPSQIPDSQAGERPSGQQPGGGQEQPPAVEQVTLNQQMVIDSGEGWWHISADELEDIEERLNLAHNPDAVSILTMLNVVYSNRLALETGVQPKALSMFAMESVVKAMDDPETNPEIAALIRQVLSGNAENATVEDVLKNPEKVKMLQNILGQLQASANNYNESLLQQQEREKRLAGILL